jgi:mono/diheme cytochrome c family protein
MWTLCAYCQEPSLCGILLTMKIRLMLCLGLLVATGCNGPRKLDSLTPEAQPAPVAARQQAAATAEPSPVEDGRLVFLANCTGCHGKNADGDTPAGRNWHAANLHSPQVQTQLDGQLVTIIRGGKGKMPAWGGLLSPLDIDHVLAYIRTLKKN